MNQLLERESSGNLTPHNGCFWERLVRSFKHVFYAVLGNRRLTDKILATTFCLEEQSLNARPLGPASAHATILEALTPSHFLFGTSGSVLLSHQQADVGHRKCYPTHNRHGTQTEILAQEIVCGLLN